jgi:hypothetical protein
LGLAISIVLSFKHLGFEQMGCRPFRVKRALGKCPPTLPGDAGERREETAQLSE